MVSLITIYSHERLKGMPVPFIYLFIYFKYILGHCLGIFWEILAVFEPS